MGDKFKNSEHETVINRMNIGPVKLMRVYLIIKKEPTRLTREIQLTIKRILTECRLWEI